MVNNFLLLQRVLQTDVIFVSVCLRASRFFFFFGASFGPLIWPHKSCSADKMFCFKRKVKPLHVPQLF